MNTNKAAGYKALVHRLAANNTPNDLEAVAASVCAALIVHYQIAIAEREGALLEAVADGRPAEYISGVIGLIAGAAAEKELVSTASDLLNGLKNGVPAAEPGAIERFIEGLDLGEDDDQEADG